MILEIISRVFMYFNVIQVREFINNSLNNTNK
jgi:hypothetical protein